jgi:hypothetical protein
LGLQGEGDEDHIQRDGFSLFDFDAVRQQVECVVAVFGAVLLLYFEICILVEVVVDFDCEI